MLVFSLLSLGPPLHTKNCLWQPETVVSMGRGGGSLARQPNHSMSSKPKRDRPTPQKRMSFDLHTHRRVRAVCVLPCPQNKEETGWLLQINPLCCLHLYKINFEFIAPQHCRAKHGPLLQDFLSFSGVPCSKGSRAQPLTVQVTVVLTHRHSCLLTASQITHRVLPSAFLIASSERCQLLLQTTNSIASRGLDQGCCGDVDP